MQIKDTDIYKLNYFTYNRAFTGSYGNMRYRLIRKKDEEEEAVLSAAVYPQPYCWEETEDEKKANTGLSIYGRGKNRNDRMAESEIERI